MIVEIKRPLRKIGLRFDALSVYLLCEQYEVDLNAINKIPEKEYLNSWIWNAYRSYQMFRYKKPRISYDKMKKIIEGMTMGEWTRISKVIHEARGKNTEEKPGDIDKKKRQPGTPSL